MQMTHDPIHRQRGQAMVETAVFLPLFLLVLFGVIWTVQSSVMSERSQISVRFSGLISDEANPYQQYSLGALYDGLPGIAASEVYACASPGPDALQNDPATGIFPGPKSPTFFQPISGTTVGSCTQGPAHLTGGALASPQLFVHTQSTVSTQVPVPSFLQGTLGSMTQFLSASQNYFDGPDVQTLLTCYNDGQTDDLGTVVMESLTHYTLDAASAPTPLPDTPVTTPLALSGSC
jgi:hypothetical protein